MASDRSPDYLSTLAKGLKVLTCFSRENPSMTLSEVAKRTDLNPAVARRCLLTLCELGYVSKTDNHFTLRPEVLVFATLFNETFDLDNIIRASLQDLRTQTGHSASFTLLTEGDVLYVAHISTQRVIRLQANTGTRFPALVTSTGRCILSTWQDHEIRQFIAQHPVAPMTDKTTTDPEALFEAVIAARQQGYAMISDELEYGITSLVFNIRPGSEGVLQDPPLPIAIEVTPGSSAENKDLAARIEHAIKDRLLVTSKVLLVTHGTLPRETYKSKLVDYSKATPAVA